LEISTIGPSSSWICSATWRTKEVTVTIKKLTVLLLLFGACKGVFAQDSTVEHLQARYVESFVLVTAGTPGTDGKFNLTYNIDSDTNLSATDFKVPLVVVAEKPFNLFGNFPNVVEYSLTTTETTSDDPNIKAIGQLVDALKNLSGIFQQAEAEAKAADAKVGAMESARATRFGPGRERTPLEEDWDFDIDSLRNIPASLATWLAHSLTVPGIEGCFDPPPKVNELIQIANDSRIDIRLELKQLLDELKNAPTRNTHNSISQNVATRISDLADDASQLTLAMERASRWSPSESLVQTKNTEKRDQKKNTESLDQENNIFAPCHANVALAEAALADLRGKVETTVRARKEALDALEKIRKRFEDVTTNGFEFPSRTELAPVDGKIKDVEIVVAYTPVTLDTAGVVTIGEAKKTTAKLRIRTYSLFTPEAAVGLFYSNLKYPKFDVEQQEDGKTVVVDAGEDSADAQEALFLNLIFRVRKERVVYPMIQLGVGRGEGRPTILLGGGLRFVNPNHLSLSLGYAQPFSKELSSLEIGSEVAGAAGLNEDLHYKLGDGKLYISVQYSF
jgi:hypothetical protein